MSEVLFMAINPLYNTTRLTGLSSGMDTDTLVQNRMQLEQLKLNRELNLTIVMVSSELLELKSICDRIAIITEGKVSAILKPSDSNENFGLAMSGIAVEGGN